MTAYAKVFGGDDDIKKDNEINEKKTMQTGCIWLYTGVGVGLFWVNNDKKLFLFVTHNLLIA